MDQRLANWLLIQPVHFLRQEHLRLHAAEIRRVDSLSESGLRQYQGLKLAGLIGRPTAAEPLAPADAAGEVPEQGLRLLESLPFLTKEAYLRQPVPASRFGVDCRSTSGSTGSPFTFYRDRLATGYMEAVQNHAYSWHGIGVGEPQGRFWGMPGGRKGAVARFKDLLKNRIRYSAFDLSEQASFAFYHRLKSFRPSYFYGYPSLILSFARFLDRNGLSLEGVPLKAVIGTGEFVYPEEKRELEALLRRPFLSEYGCSEIGVIAFDCPHGNMHVMSSNVIVEIIGPEGCVLPEGAEGEIVVTELNARVLPFVRYRLGDRGFLEKASCACGRKFPVLRVSAGRKDDYILTPEGKVVYDAILAYTLKKGVLQFKAVQSRLDLLRIEVVSNGEFSDALEKRYRAQLQASLSPTLAIEFVRVERIEREKSGKLRYFRSELGGSTHG